MSRALDIRQTCDVATYQQEFENLMHQLLAHNPAIDETFFVAKFVEGLKRDIRVVVIIHQPRTVDAAISLALLHEAQLQDYRRGRYEVKKWHNRAGRGKLGIHPAEKETPPEKPIAVPVPNKFAELRRQRKERNECFKCGGKFVPGHKCPKQVELSVIAEICEALEVSSESESKGADTCSQTSDDTARRPGRGNPHCTRYLSLLSSSRRPLLATREGKP
jgi:hypothetical protein